MSVVGGASGIWPTLARPKEPDSSGNLFLGACASSRHATAIPECLGIQHVARLHRWALRSPGFDRLRRGSDLLVGLGISIHEGARMGCDIEHDSCDLADGVRRDGVGGVVPGDGA